MGSLLVAQFQSGVEGLEDFPSNCCFSIYFGSLRKLVVILQQQGRSAYKWEEGKLWVQLTLPASLNKVENEWRLWSASDIQICMYMCSHTWKEACTYMYTTAHREKGEKTLDIGRFMWRLNHIVDVLLLGCSLAVLNFKHCFLFLLYKHRSLQNLHTCPIQTLNLHMTLVIQVIVTIIVLICYLSSVFYIFIFHWKIKPK